jgi:hypothetical protein
MKSTHPARLAAGAATVVAVGTLAAGCGTEPAPQSGAAREVRGVVAAEPLFLARVANPDEP